MIPTDFSRRRFIAASAGSLLLVACGDDDKSSSAAPAPQAPDPQAPAPETENPAPEPPPEPAPEPDPEPEPDPKPATHPPRGLHVSFTGDARSSRSVTWFTDGMDSPPSFLEYDAVTEFMDEKALREKPFANRVAGEFEQTTGLENLTHRATATGIDPDLPFRYRVGSDEGGWSAVKVVTPMPSEDWSFIHYGDQGVNPRAEMVHREILKTPSDLVLIAGDLSYANGDQPIWDDWFAQEEALLATRPMLAAPGNHEEKDFGGDAFKNRFTHPGKPVTSIITGDNPGSSFYSFDVNRVHFLVTTAGALINDGTLPEELLNIEADLSLAAVRRALGEIDFIVVMQHFPIWTDQLGRSPANPALVALEENIIVRYGVDMLLVGHDHVYQRSVPMSFGSPNPLGYVQVMVGTGGASIRLFDEDGPQSWSAKQFVGIGFAHYRVSSGKIEVEYLGAPPLDMSDEGRQRSTGNFAVEDRFTVNARDLLACRDCVKAPRNREELESLLETFRLAA